MLNNILKIKFNTSNTREITSYLKGFAICSVIVVHYINYYYYSLLVGYANGVISIFFMLSGYGLFHSLQKDFGSDKITWQTLARYFYKRATRIFPLYWLALLLTLLIYQSPLSLNLFLAVRPFDNNYTLYWFIQAIVQCYLIAPLMYLLLKKCGLIKYIFGILILLFSICFFYDLSSVPLNQHFLLPYMNII